MTHKKTEVYIAKLLDRYNSETFYKIGLSKNLEWRFSRGITELSPGEKPYGSYNIKVALLAKHGRKPHPYKVNILHSVSFDDEDKALRLEKHLLKAVSPIKYTPLKNFSGRTECFLHSSSMDEIIEAIIGAMDGEKARSIQ